MIHYYIDHEKVVILNEVTLAPRCVAVQVSISTVESEILRMLRILRMTFSEVLTIYSI